MKETDLFEPVKQHYIGIACEVFSEVLAYGGKRADVVIRDENIITVIELKTSLSLDLLEQCYEWLGHAHYVYACVPAIKKGQFINRYARKCLMQDGIGLLNVRFTEKWAYELLEKSHPNRYNAASISTLIQPRFNRRVDYRWNDYLTERHKFTLPGGSKGGGYLTSYKEMMEDIKGVVERRKNGVPIETLITYTGDHYSNPRRGLLQALAKYESSWCEIYKENGDVYCRLKNTC